MSLDPVCECPTEPSSAPVAATEAPAPKRRTERTDGRGRRFRFGDAVDTMNDTPPRPVTGSIAISFAVVSRRNWPR